MSEQTEQREVVRWARLQERVFPALRMLHHVPNGGDRKRVEAAIMIGMGVRPGWPDLSLPAPRSHGTRRYAGLVIEMKADSERGTAHGGLSKSQRKVLPVLASEGHLVTVVYSAVEAISLIRMYLGRELPEHAEDFAMTLLIAGEHMPVLGFFKPVAMPASSIIEWDAQV